MGTDIYLYAEVLRDGQWQYEPISLPDDRNYYSFSVLANVRNGYGFAFCDTGDPVIPIAMPRGIPDDSPVIDKLIDCHSCSWVTLRELLDYDLDQLITLRGMVDKITASHFYATGKAPQSWCAWTNQVDYENIEWQVPLRDAAWLLVQLIDILKSLGDPNRVRLVFGFDS